MNLLKQNKKNEIGQTLIETIVAIFILTTALTAGLALTIYIFSNSERSVSEIVATNLAREGVDVVRNMRDTNWLESDAIGGAYALINNCTLNAFTFPCFPKTWEGVSNIGYHNYDLTVAGNYRLQYNNSANAWSLGVGSYALYKQIDGSYTHVANGTSVFSRKVVLSKNTNAPFGAANFSELIVTSVVAWTGKTCLGTAAAIASDPSNTNCNVAVTERLTNWKDYK